MTIDDQIRDEKLQYDINREGEDILPSINNKYLNKQNLLILLWEKILKNKQKQLNIKLKH